MNAGVIGLILLESKHRARDLHTHAFDAHELRFTGLNVFHLALLADQNNGLSYFWFPAVI